MPVTVLDSCVLVEDLPLAERMKHGSMTVYIDEGSRVFTHELVRHRKDMSYSQQSQRYVDERGFEAHIPEGMEEGEALEYFRHVMEKSAKAYVKLRELGLKKQDARYVLPNAVIAPIVVTGTWKAWRHFFSLRMAKAAQPEMRKIASIIALDAAVNFPEAFDGLFIEAALILSQEFGLTYELKVSDRETTQEEL